MSTVDTNILKTRLNLLSWYDKNKRDLPWRLTKDPYKIWVSEIMLQQTQVKTVIPYYEKFLKRFPSVVNLAKAGEQDVLKYWAGLGYYRRALLLHKAAQEIQRGLKGSFPKRLEKIKELPGVGTYTAAAVASIAFGVTAPVVDGNVIRVLCRFFGLKGDPYQLPQKAKLERLATELLHKTRPGDFNQAVMELGALLCTPRAPACLLCPLREDCAARRAGLQEVLPQLAARKAAEKVNKVVVVPIAEAVRGAKVFILSKKQEKKGKGKMEGMWGFPEMECQVKEVPGKVLRGIIKNYFDAVVEPEAKIADFTHSIMHYRIHVQAFFCVAQSKWFSAAKKPGKWVKVTDLDDYPMAAAEQKIFSSLKSWLANRKTKLGRNGLGR